MNDIFKPTVHPDTYTITPILTMNNHGQKALSDLATKN